VYIFIYILYKYILNLLSSAVPGVLHAVRQRQLLRPRGPAVLRVSLPRAARLAVLRLPEAHHGPLHHGHGQEVPPGALCVRLLPEAAQQRLLQGAERQAVLPGLLRQALQLECRTPSHTRVQHVGVGDGFAGRPASRALFTLFLKMFLTVPKEICIERIPPVFTAHL